MDGSLIERARTGDADAFDELARSRIDSVYRTALAILGSPADARDATQETLVSMWRGLPSLRSAEAFDGWLHRITVNSSKMALRRQHRSSPRRLLTILRLERRGGRATTAKPCPPPLARLRPCAPQAN